MADRVDVQRPSAVAERRPHLLRTSAADITAIIVLVGVLKALVEAPVGQLPELLSIAFWAGKAVILLVFPLIVAIEATSRALRRLTGSAASLRRWLPVTLTLGVLGAQLLRSVLPLPAYGSAGLTSRLTIALIGAGAVGYGLLLGRR